MDNLIKLDQKCKLHLQEDVFAVCMKQDCEYDYRLLCRRCLTTNHFKHGDYCILFEDINKKKLLRGNWPKQKRLQAIKDFLLVEEKRYNVTFVDKLYDELKTMILEQIEQSRRQVKELIEKQKEERSKLQNIIEDELDKILHVDELKKLINLQFECESSQDLVQHIQYVESSVREYNNLQIKYLEETRTINDWFEEHNFQQIFKTVKQAVSQLTKASLIPAIPTRNITFGAKPGCETKIKIDTIYEGRHVKMFGNPSVVYSNSLDPEDVYQMKISIKALQQNLYFGIVDEEFKDCGYLPNTPRVRLATPNESNKGMIRFGGEVDITEYCRHANAILRVTFFAEQNMFNIEYGNGCKLHLSHDQQLNGKRWRLYFFSNAVEEQSFIILN